jgi:three-Cys-motif partner protein
VIARRWSSIASSTDPKERNGNVYLFNDDLETSLKLINNMRLGNSIFFFDPLLFTPWSEINNVAKSRIKTYYKTGTEFIVFLFTSDWFMGRGELSPLPTTNDSNRWTEKQRSTVKMIDTLFGDEEFKNELINENATEERIEKMVELYRKKLHTWFRYVLPLPFQPKTKQIYHLFFCTNYERGLAITRDFYTRYTGNPKYSPNNNDAYSKFRKLHPEKDLGNVKRSVEWKILWNVIKDHEEGICDVDCLDLVEKEKNVELRKKAFYWLESHNYIKEKKHIAFEWHSKPKIYDLQWYSIEMQLGISPPEKLEPLSTLHSQSHNIDTKS